MRFLLWIAAAAALALWSLLAWVGHALVPAAAGLIGAVPAWLGLDPAAAAPLAGVLDALVPVVEAALLLVWGLGALIILAAPVVVGRLARRARDASDGAAGLALSWLERRRRRRSSVIEGVAYRVVDGRVDPRHPGPARW